MRHVDTHDKGAAVKNKDHLNKAAPQAWGGLKHVDGGRKSAAQHMRSAHNTHAEGPDLGSGRTSNWVSLWLGIWGFGDFFM